MSEPKVSTKYESVECMDCQAKYDLFYDLTLVKDREEDSEEGADIDNDRDPIRCVLCRKYTRSAHNEILQCENCLETNTSFVWTGPHNDTIVCVDCVSV
jgi:hypothetical protein